MPRRALPFAAALSLLHATTALGGVLDPGPEHLWVGFDPTCDFNNIQAAIDAASTTRGAVIHLVAVHFTAVALVVQDKDILLQGGHVACRDDALVARTVLDRAPHVGAPGAPVLAIRGSANVSASRIEFINGGQGTVSQHGGGISFQGTGSLVLGNVLVSNNVAQVGGGIAVSASGGPALLWLQADTRIANNRALDDGGGILIEGVASLRVHAPDVSIATNVAEHGGGGIAIGGGANASIASGSAADPALIDGNEATDGAGISVAGEGLQGASWLRVFSIDPRHPTVLRGNRAMDEGGAIHAGQALIGPEPGVRVCVSDTRIEGNEARDGAIVYATRPLATRGGGSVSQPPTVRLGVAHNAADCPGPDLAAYGAVACLPGTRCNHYSGNSAWEDTQARGGAPLPPGSLITARRGATVYVERATVQLNAALGGVLDAQDGAYIGISDSVLSQNFLFGPVLRTHASGSAMLRRSTVADNELESPAIVNAGDLAVTQSIFSFGDAALLANEAGALVEFAHVLASNFDGVPADAISASLIGESRFVDRGAGNFRLANDSLAIDFAPATLSFDLDGTERGHDAPRADRFGTLDLGAYEWTPNFLPGRLFGDGLEAVEPGT